MYKSSGKLSDVQQRWVTTANMVTTHLLSKWTDSSKFKYLIAITDSVKAAADKITAVFDEVKKKADDNELPRTTQRVLSRYYSGSV